MTCSNPELSSKLSELDLGYRLNHSSFNVLRKTDWVGKILPEMTNITPGRRQSKTSMLSTNFVDQNSLEIEFSIAICRPIGDKWQSKTLFLSIFDPRSSIVKSVFDCHLPGVHIGPWKFNADLFWVGGIMLDIAYE